MKYILVSNRIFNGSDICAYICKGLDSKMYILFYLQYALVPHTWWCLSSMLHIAATFFVVEFWLHSVLVDFGRHEAQTVGTSMSELRWYIVAYCRKKCVSFRFVAIEVVLYTSFWKVEPLLLRRCPPENHIDWQRSIVNSSSIWFDNIASSSYFSDILIYCNAHTCLLYIFVICYHTEFYHEFEEKNPHIVQCHALILYSWHIWLQQTSIFFKRQAVRTLCICLDNDQLDAHLLYFTIRQLQSSACFEHYMLIIRRFELYWCSICYRHSENKWVV